MPHFVEDMQSEAAAAIAAMKDAALVARRRHAHAELMRHMQMTAAKVKHKNKAEAVEAVVSEWMEAWHLPRSEWPHLAKEMQAFTEAFYDYVNNPDDAADRRVRDTSATLDATLARQGTSIADQMAWRSMCAHGWWELVAPTPQDLPGRTARPTVPRPEDGKPFWDTGCAAQCLG
jgi:hypothetical protein